jgi:hypothetical protein
LLKDRITKDIANWEKLYKHDFLSDTHVKDELNCVFWCTRMSENKPTKSTIRSELLASVDWYNTYRRRVTTENNWRSNHLNIIYTNISYRKKQKIAFRCGLFRGILFHVNDACRDKYINNTYNREYSAHSNIKQHTNNLQKHYLPEFDNVMRQEKQN